ncbi:hypothetical protein IMSHALPRED_001530 [Imshaugia aleurites]|uniref:Nephrocystin 3-like N-terminal domain-containing protein n=1 Tax=Imshaugia aleurites TaxID=172621 RepID=A0A8H3J2L5_9LECA|nr:hypothetical protein IMSHALPRED_001530 [Imshaugia aleurites]
MGDPLSITAGIIAVLQFTKEVIEYGLDFAHAPKVVSRLKKDFQSLQQLLDRLKDRCESTLRAHNFSPPWFQGLWEVHRRPLRNGSYEYEYGGFIWDLRQAIDEAMAKLNPTREWKKREAYQRFTWYFKKDTIKEIQKIIQRYLTAITTTLALKHDETLEEVKDLVKKGNAQLYAIEKHGERRRKEAEEAEREEITNWLSPFSFIAKRDELLTTSFTQVGEFLWSDERFQAWAEGRPWFLRCIGDLGVGKTVLSAIFGHRLTQARPQGGPAPLILFIYLDYKFSKIQTWERLVGSLLQQLLQLNGSLAVPEELKIIHKKAKRLGYELSMCYSEVRRVLVDELNRFDRFYIIVDGFDELAPPERLKLLKELQSLKPGKVNLLLTSRSLSDRTDSDRGSYECDRCHKKDLKLYFHCRICEGGNFDICYDCKGHGLWCDERAHELVEPYQMVEIEVKFPAEDIERFVRWEIGVEIENSKSVLTDERDTVLKPVTTSLKDLFRDHPELPRRIITEVTDKAAGRFLYARVYVDAIKTKTNLPKLIKALETLPEKLDDIWTDAMLRIQQQDSEAFKRVFRILGILTCVRRSLRLEELKHALAVLMLDEFSGEEDYSEDDLWECIDDTRTILGSTSSLVVVEANRVSLVHDSLEVYLREGTNSSQWLSNAEFDLAKASILYLQLVLPSQDCQDDYYASKNAKFAFLQYASQYWGDHVRDASQNPEHAQYLQMKAFQLLNDSHRMNACMQAAWVTNPGGFDTSDVWKGVDRLHICAWFGLSSVISEMDPEPGTVDKEEPKYAQTPLMYACRKGYFETARLLLRLGASQKKVSARGRTALFEAILGHQSRSNAKTSTISRHAKVVELLAEEMPRDLDINMRHSEERDRTALMLVAQRGQLDMIDILLKHQGVGIDMQDANGKTAIVLAIREGHFAIVQHLLKAKADIGIVDFEVGRSPLTCAAERDREDIVKMLLRHNADPTVTDREGGTAMLHAVTQGADKALEEMLNHNLDIECVDEHGQSLLHGAARNGHDKTIGILLRKKRLGVNVRDNWGMTPLHDASRSGGVAVASVLLKNGADASLEDHFQRTPFVSAWQYGQKEVTSMLTSHSPEHQPPIPLDDAKLPIWAMARRGLTDLLTSTIESRSQDLTILEPYSEKSSLHCAIEAHHPAILQTLLESPHILPQVNQRDHFGRSPLHTAALLGDTLACQLLLSAGANVNLQDRWDDPPIVLAHANGHFDVMLLLIKADVNVTALADQPRQQHKIDLKRLFFFAVEEKDAKAVGRLIEEYGVDRSVQNSEGWRAVQIARAADDEAMVRVLNAAPTVYMGEEGGEMDNGRKVDARRGEGRGVRFVPFRSRPVELDD